MMAITKVRALAEQCLASEPISDLRESLPLASAEAQAGQASLQNPVPGGEVLILQ